MENTEVITADNIDELSEEELDTALKQVTNPETNEEGTQSEETPAEPKEDDGEPKEELSIEDRLKALEEQNQKLSKRVKDKDSYIEQRNAEIGLLRKQIRQRELDELPDDVDIESDEFLDNPKEAINKVLAAKEKKKELLEKEKREQLQQAIEQNRKMVEEVEPDFEERIPDIVKILKADKAPDNVIKSFEENPHATFPAVVTMQLAKRANLEKRVAELEAQLKEANGKPNKIIDNINKYGKTKSKVTSSAPTKKGKGILEGLTEQDIDNLSLEELEELEKQLAKK